MGQYVLNVFACESESSRIIFESFGPLALGFEDAAAIVEGIRVLVQTECLRQVGRSQCQIASHEKNRCAICPRIGKGSVDSYRSGEQLKCLIELALLNVEEAEQTQESRTIRTQA